MSARVLMVDDEPDAEAAKVDPVPLTDIDWWEWFTGRLFAYVPSTLA